MTKSKRIDIERIDLLSVEELADAYEKDASDWANAIKVMNECRDRANRIYEEMHARSMANEQSLFVAQKYPDEWSRLQRLTRVTDRNKEAYRLAVNVNNYCSSIDEEPLDLKPLLEILKGLADE